ncbi:flagellar hook-associated protein FlgK [Rhodoferax sp. 4810]|uniref:Flagellar hook-associated protein 1 n=1 Tax=Thiospirillum jenense TaxID=1653858 RepID=A0A839H8Y7_9GAMM|nr:flagellar hook-associated protein FlgK [Thiospirillum jenense]MBB1073947.1 flagellar hook-associated protein FlgK [Rhodoferax jenense]MBB1125823.1 flagellar hook-associated protein FlgK [Thiospirillum jenense]
MSITGTGLSGLIAFQRALNTTGHNIANAATEGYSRQRVELENRNPQYLGNQYFGQGVDVATVRRLQSEFIDNELRNTTATKVSNTVRADYAQRVDNMLADEETSLATVLERFFGAVNDFADDPTSEATANITLHEADSLVQRFNMLNSTIEEQRDQINGSIGVAVQEISDMAAALAGLNQRIVAAYGASGGSAAPNDLLDQRGALLTRLAEKIDVRINEQEDHSVNVFIGTGQSLVLGITSNQLVARPLGNDPRNVDIGILTSNGEMAVNISRFMTGGEISGLLEARSNIVDSAQNGLGLVAVTLSTFVNRQNQLGLTSGGELGQAVFSLPTPAVYPHANNGDDSIPTVTLMDEAVGSLTASDYQLRFDDTTAEYQLIRLNDNTVLTTGVAGDVLEADGLRVDLGSITSVGLNDRWLIQPTRNAAGQMAMQMTDANHLAPISGALTNAENDGSAALVNLRVTTPDDPNTQAPAAVVYDGTQFQVVNAEYGGTASGSATIESLRVVDATSVTPATILFNAASNSFSVNGATIVPRDSSGVTTIRVDGVELKIRGVPADGDTFNIGLTPTAITAPQPALTTVAGNGWELDIYGEPQAGDYFSLQLSRNRVGDNRNLLSMADLAEQRLITGTQTFSDSYNTVVAEIGTRTRQAQISRDATTSLFEDAQARRESESGVNLDEEAASLLRYQQAYQASAKVISVSNSVFDILFSAIGR